jgi:hypothetical protein
MGPEVVASRPCSYGAVCTPDFFGFNANLELQYRGRLDASRKEAVADAGKAVPST